MSGPFFGFTPPLFGLTPPFLGLTSPCDCCQQPSTQGIIFLGVRKKAARAVFCGVSDVSTFLSGYRHLAVPEPIASVPPNPAEGELYTDVVVTYNRASSETIDPSEGQCFNTVTGEIEDEEQFTLKEFVDPEFPEFKILTIDTMSEPWPDLVPCLSGCGSSSNPKLEGAGTSRDFNSMTYSSLVQGGCGADYGNYCGDCPDDFYCYGNGNPIIATNSTESTYEWEVDGCRDSATGTVTTIESSEANCCFAFVCNGIVSQSPDPNPSVNETVTEYNQIDLPDPITLETDDNAPCVVNGQLFFVVDQVNGRNTYKDSSQENYIEYNESDGRWRYGESSGSYQQSERTTALYPWLATWPSEGLTVQRGGATATAEAVDPIDIKDVIKAAEEKLMIVPYKTLYGGDYDFTESLTAFRDSQGLFAGVDTGASYSRRTSPFSESGFGNFAQVDMSEVEYVIAVERPPATCYIKMWLVEEFLPSPLPEGWPTNPTTGVPEKQVIGSFEVEHHFPNTGDGLCHKQPDATFFGTLSIISEPRIQNAPSETGKKSIRLIKYSLLEGYTPNDPYIENGYANQDCKPNQFPNPAIPCKEPA